MFQLVSAIKGEVTVKEIFKHKRNIGSIYVDIFYGYEVEVICLKRQYISKFSRSFYKSKIHTVFDVYCRVSGDPPEILARSLGTKITFPPLIPTCLDDSMHVRVLVNAYLDMIQKLINVELRR